MAEYIDSLEVYKGIVREHQKNIMGQGRKHWSKHEQILNNLEELAISAGGNELVNKLLPQLILIDPFVVRPLSFLYNIENKISSIDEIDRKRFYENLARKLKEKVEIYYKNVQTLYETLKKVGSSLIEEMPDNLPNRHKERKLTYIDAKWLGLNNFKVEDYKPMLLKISKKRTPEEIIIEEISI